MFDKITSNDYIISGGIDILFFILISVFCVSSVVVMVGEGAFGAIFSGFMLIIYAGHYFQGWFAENDPQWIGIGLQLLGVIFAIRSVQDNSNAYNLFISSLFCALGFYTKHNEVSLILFIMLYLFFSDRKKTLLFSMYFFSMIFTFLFIFYIIYGYNFLYDVFLHPRIQVLHQITKASPKVKMFAPLICVSFYYFKINGLNKKTFSLLGFLIFSFLSGCYMQTGDGVSINVHLDTLIACTIISGLLIKNLEIKKPLMLFLLSFIVFMLPTFRMVRHASQLEKNIQNIHLEADRWQNVIRYIEQQHDLVACRMLSICFWAGKPFTVDFFNMGQYLQVGGVNHIFEKMVSSKSFSVIEYPILNDEEGRREQDVVMKILIKNYKKIFELSVYKPFYPDDSTMIFYIPKNNI